MTDTGDEMPAELTAVTVTAVGFFNAINAAIGDDLRNPSIIGEPSRFDRVIAEHCPAPAGCRACGLPIDETGPSTGTSAGCHRDCVQFIAVRTDARTDQMTVVWPWSVTGRLGPPRRRE